MSTHPWINPDTAELLPGVYYDMSDADYQALPAVRWSSLKVILESPKALKYAATHPRADTDALAIGRAVHLAVLQPHAYDAAVQIIPDDYMTASGKRSTSKAAKAWYATVDPSVTLITQREHDACVAMAEAVAMANQASAILTESVDREVTAICQLVTPQGQVVMAKARADLIGPTILADLKSDENWKGFDLRRVVSRIIELDYHGQMGWYEKVFDLAADQTEDERVLNGCHSWGWIFAHKKPPYDVIAGRASADLQDLGRWRADEAWERYAEALDTGIWPGVEPEEVTFEAPRWARPREDDAVESLGIIGIEGGER